jgi:hypothetical protein
MGKVLTAEIVLSRSKADRLDNIRNLNLWGNEIEDVRILRQIPNVEVLSLSVNKINTLRDFSYCKKLSELYLRKNMVADLDEIRSLQSLPNLRILWLWENPIAEKGNYRSFIIRALPNLTKLDNQAVTPEERTAAAAVVEHTPTPAPPTVTHSRREPSPVQRPSTSAAEVKPSRPRRVKPSTGENRNENILCAVLALLKELDDHGLELVKRDIERKLSAS